MRKLVSILVLFIAHHTNSQTSFTYQLKPPSVTIHFGSGQVRDINTSDLYSYGQVMSSCPTDGHYSFVPATSDCFRGDWHTLEEDHTPGDASGNMLLVKNTKDEDILVLSQSAFDSLIKEQRQMLEAYATLLPVSIPTIEKTEGGSVRCMMAEIFLQRKASPVRDLR